MNYLHNAHKNGEDFKPKNLSIVNDTDTILQALLAKEPSVKNNFSEKLLGIAERSLVQMHFKKYISLFDYDWLTDIDNEMNFNFFHLAAIFGDQEVFEALLKSKCMNHLNFANDRIVNIKPLDYAFILGNYNVINIINEH